MPPPPSLSNFTRAPPMTPRPLLLYSHIHTELLYKHEHKHKYPLKLLKQRIIFILLFFINIIYIRNAWILYIDAHLIFILQLTFTYTYNNRLCLRGYYSQRFSTRGPSLIRMRPTMLNVTVLCVEHNYKFTFSFTISFSLYIHLKMY